MTNVVIVAPTLAVRLGLRALLSDSQGLAVIGEGANLREVDEFLPETDVVLAAGENLLKSAPRPELERMLWGATSSPAILLLSESTEEAQPLTGLPVRAWGLLPLDVSGEELVAAVRALAEGLVVVAPLFFDRLLARPLIGEAAGEEPMVQALTAREAEVLQLLARGQPNKQIATALGISEHTVKFHVSAIYAKLGATNRTEAVRAGARRGLVVL